MIFIFASCTTTSEKNEKEDDRQETLKRFEEEKDKLDERIRKLKEDSKEKAEEAKRDMRQRKNMRSG